ncbi:uncharacterized protein PV06_04611 [Exophiala oligosperma]|uniref:Uncharacterized protein n=1 Tax=Exophiala oligosperma TaxID=215243 RepID=A0A0D2C1G3_9EURO|nr:uncharacterized protein PV06_04611 [Exophiala oligosperma]KIW43517.1 hypothetical protein PV06_04611 [Exophiala oligosperma]
MNTPSLSDVSGESQFPPDQCPHVALLGLLDANLLLDHHALQQAAGHGGLEVPPTACRVHEPPPLTELFVVVCRESDLTDVGDELWQRSVKNRQVGEVADVGVAHQDFSQLLHAFEVSGV